MGRNENFLMSHEVHSSHLSAVAVLRAQIKTVSVDEWACISRTKSLVLQLNGLSPQNRKMESISLRLRIPIHICIYKP